MSRKSTSLSEFEFIARIRGRQTYSSFVVEGIGDDCAVLECGSGTKQVLMTTDLLTQGIHFELSWGRPDLLGRKSVAVNLSDIAAMGGKPMALLCALCIPPGQISFAEEVMKGIEAECRDFEVDLVGGDSNAGKTDFTICITLLGEIEKAAILRRVGAKPRDYLFCSGTLGDSGLGLKMIKDPTLNSKWSMEEKEIVVAKFLKPIPRVQLAMDLAKIGGLTAMIDVSDGLLQDLGHLVTSSKVDAFLDHEAIPISQTFRKSGLSIIEACSSGEDYELLFTAPKELERQILNLSKPEQKITRIGEITNEGTGKIIGRDGFSWDVTKGGYQHF